MTAQYHDTKCLICETTIHAPVENFVCNTCHNDDYSTVADFIVKQNARIAALEAQNKKLVEALTFIKNYDNYATDGDLQVSDTEVTHVSNYAESVLSEVTK